MTAVEFGKFARCEGFAEVTVQNECLGNVAELDFPRKGCERRGAWRGL
jgi:hypothetical protein